MNFVHYCPVWWYRCRHLAEGRTLRALRPVYREKHFQCLPADERWGLNESKIFMEAAMKNTHSSIVRFCLFVFLAAAAAHAQVDYTTATLKGTVLDPQGAVISGATVSATNSATAVSKTTKSGSDGSYQISALPPGSYQITFSSQGFSKVVAKMELTVGQAQICDAHM